MLFFFCAVFFCVCLASSFLKSFLPSHNTSPLTLQGSWRCSEVQFSDSSTNDMVAAKEKKKRGKKYSFSLCLSVLSSSLCHDVAVMLSVTKHRADEWLMKAQLVKHKLTFSWAQKWENKRKVTNGLLFETWSILGRPYLDKQVLICWYE